MRQQLPIEKKYEDYEGQAYQNVIKEDGAIDPMRRFESKQAFMMGAATMMSLLTACSSLEDYTKLILDHRLYFKDLSEYVKPPEEAIPHMQRGNYNSK